MLIGAGVKETLVKKWFSWNNVIISEIIIPYCYYYCFFVLRVIYRHEELGQELGERAMAATRQVVSQQSVERKRLMQRLKEGFGACVQATVAWRRLISDLTHPSAVFHFPELYPKYAFHY